MGRPVPSFSGWLDGVMAFAALHVAPGGLRGTGVMGKALSATSARLVEKPSTTKPGPYPHYSRLSLREWFMLIHRGMRPVEAIGEIPRIVLIFMASLAILRSRLSPETTIQKGQPQHFYLKAILLFF